MHNGCLLLLAFVAVFQPIASYTERGLVNGRQERCDYRTSVRDSELNFHETYRFNKPAVEDRRLNQRADIRKLRRNEVKEDTLRIALSSDRRLADTVERERITLTRLSNDRIGNDAVLHREIRKTRPVSSHRDERKQEIQRERISTAQQSHQARFSDRRENSRLSENRSQSIDNKRFNERVSVESRRDTGENGINADTQRIREHREVRFNRARDNGARTLNERRVTREAAQEMDTRRSVYRIQHDRNAEREILNRRSSGEIRSSSTTGDRVNRASANEGSHLTTQDTTSLGRNDRQTSSTQRFVVEQRQSDSRIQLTFERRHILNSANRRVLDDRISENRRNAQRAQSVDTRREIRDTENEARLARAVRSVDDHRFQKDLSGSRIFKREITAENRRNARSMAASLERSAEYRKDSRREFSKQVLENRNDNHNIETEARQSINNIRAAETRKAIQNAEKDFRAIELNAKRTVETCVYDREPSSEHRMARMMTRERSQENRWLTRDVRPQTIRTERIDEERQETRNIGIRAFRTERSDESGRDARNIEVRAFGNERAVRRQRDSRSFGTRSSRIERSKFRSERTDESRRDDRTIEVPSLRRERAEESRREARSIGVRSFKTERSEQSRRDARNVNSQLFRDERTDENLRHASNFELQRAFRTERTDGSRRDARIVGARSFRSERTDESRRNAHEVGIRAFRSEHADEADARSNRVLAFKTERSDKSHKYGQNIEDVRAIESGTYRRYTQGIERQSRSLDRVPNSRRESQSNNRDARIQERTFGSRRTVRNIVSRAEDERANNRRATRSLERDIRSMRRERSLQSRLNRDSKTITLDRRSEETMRGSDGVIERLDKRDSLDSRRSFTFQRDTRRDTQRNHDRDNFGRRHMEAKSRNSFDTDFAKKREFQGMFRNPAQTENGTTTMNWQYIFYTLQGLYICGLLIQFNKGSVEKKTRVSWWPTPQRLIKVD
ncbi:zinc finger CCCH domain-containing protein 13-like [Cydia pomonella]|uniref:zinc finger CCCH domain-containing protein 13-like n=1 Tax=Cydia pomonella TaxID=82600 RepID=UPI002ADE52E6|nr:zinc finger CCCH domain-containing protein 13-like [Cydia pomonella]